MVVQAVSPLMRGGISPAKIHQQSHNHSGGSGELAASSRLLNDLQKHLDDYQKGRGHLSERMPQQINSLHRSTGEILSEYNPETLLDYRSYTTMLSYSDRSRFVSGVSNGTGVIAALQNTDYLSPTGRISTVA